MPFYYTRTIRFEDTDGAGVVYFANIFRICHEAYEASLAAVNIDLKTFFCQPTIAFPIVETQAKFYRPMVCGDAVLIELTPERCQSDEYKIEYQLSIGDRQIAKATTRHVCIHATQRTRQELPQFLLNWLDRISQLS